MRGNIIRCLAVLAVATSAVLCACSDKKKKESGATERSQQIKEHIAEVKDSAVMMRLLGVGDDSIAVEDNHTGKRQTLDYSHALFDKAIKGSLRVGDTLSIVPVSGDKAVKSIVNVSELLGRWFYDIRNHRGFRLEYKGAMSSFNNQLVSYREWKVLNGTLFFYYVGMQQEANSGDDYQVDTAQIVSLSRDNMEILFRGANLKCQRLNRKLKMSDIK